MTNQAAFTKGSEDWLAGCKKFLRTRVIPLSPSLLPLLGQLNSDQHGSSFMPKRTGKQNRRYTGLVLLFHYTAIAWYNIDYTPQRAYLIVTRAVRRRRASHSRFQPPSKSTLRKHPSFLPPLPAMASKVY
jgi:hypothetical protein